MDNSAGSGSITPRWNSGSGPSLSCGVRRLLTLTIVQTGRNGDEIDGALRVRGASAGLQVEQASVAPKCALDGSSMRGSSVRSAPEWLQPWIKNRGRCRRPTAHPVSECRAPDQSEFGDGVRQSNTIPALPQAALTPSRVADISETGSAAPRSQSRRKRGQCPGQPTNLLASTCALTLGGRCGFPVGATLVKLDHPSSFPAILTGGDRDAARRDLKAALPVGSS